MKPNDVLFLLMGIAISAFGLKVIVQPKYESFRFGYINFGEHHQSIGTLIFIVGVLAIFSALRKK